VAVRPGAFTHKQAGIQLYVFGGVQDFSQRTCNQVMRTCGGLVDWDKFFLGKQFNSKGGEL